MLAIAAQVTCIQNTYSLWICLDTSFGLREKIFSELTNKTFKACLEAMTQLDIQGNMCIFQEMNRTVDDVGIKNIWVTEDYSSVSKSFALNI